MYHTVSYSIITYNLYGINHINVIRMDRNELKKGQSTLNELRQYSKRSTKNYSLRSKSSSRISSTTSSSKTSSTITPTQGSQLDLDEVLTSSYNVMVIKLYLGSSKRFGGFVNDAKISENLCRARN